MSIWLGAVFHHQSVSSGAVSNCTATRVSAQTHNPAHGGSIPTAHERDV